MFYLKIIGNLIIFSKYNKFKFIFKIIIIFIILYLNLFKNIKQIINNIKFNISNNENNIIFKNNSFKKIIYRNITAKKNFYRNNTFKKKIYSKLDYFKYNKSININNSNNITILDPLDNLINKLNKNKNLRIPKFILFFDYFENKYCLDTNAFLIFQYYLQNNNSNVYYIINNESDLYFSLLLENKTKNLIPVKTIDHNFWSILYPYLLNSKIIVQSYIFYDFHKLVNKVSYLKYLKINHGIRFFKRLVNSEFFYLNSSKINTIVSSPYEYKLLKNKYNLNDNQMYKAGLPRFDRFQIIEKKENEKKCILLLFTYRSYEENLYDKSLYKKNIIKLLNNKLLISFLKKRNIDLIYIQHHHDLFRNRIFNQTIFKYAKYKNQTFLKHYIEQCSLCVTDISSFSFDFMFQNKPSLFYLLDYNETFDFVERSYIMNFPKDSFLNNSIFYDQKSLIKKIKYYIKREFKLEDYLKVKYESLFYYKNNITQRISNIIEDIIKKIEI